jgi:catechol 2,3-dioxygenase-like lactoylglutathione lyase family enzyme
MPRGIFHAVVLTDDLDASVRFLSEVCGIAPVERYVPQPDQLAETFGWPVDTGTTEAAVIGQGPGMLEVIAIPASLRSTVTPGVALLAVATGDVDGKAEAARAAGFQPSPTRTADGAGGAKITMAPVTVGGVGYELVRFD